MNMKEGLNDRILRRGNPTLMDEGNNATACIISELLVARMFLYFAIPYKIDNISYLPETSCYEDIMLFCKGTSCQYRDGSMCALWKMNS